MPTIVRVRKEASASGNHKHISRVKTTADVEYTRQDVINSINAGNEWFSQSPGGVQARVRVRPCRYGDLTQYIRTDADSTTSDNLDNLPEF
jgi:hypothetical protein